MVNLAQTPPMAVDEQDLTVETVAAQYALGQVIEFRNMTTGLIDRYIYAKAHAALTQYAPYAIYTAASTASGSEVVTAAPVANTAQQVILGVPQAAFTSSYYGWLKTKGLTTIVTTTGLVGDSYGQVIGAAATVIDGSTGPTPITTDFCANAGATSTGASHSVRLLGVPVSITT